MAKSNAGSKAANGVAHAINIVKNSAQLAKNIAAQNYVGATFNAAQLLPYLIALLLFLLIVPMLIFLALPAMVIENFSDTLIPNNAISSSFVQDSVEEVYGEHIGEINGNVQRLKGEFLGGTLDSLIDFNHGIFGNSFNLDITRMIRTDGILVDAVWFAVLHSVHFGNDPANITAEGTAGFLAGMFAYGVTETINDIIEEVLDNPLTLLVTRTLNIEFRQPLEIMRILEFDDQQILWARFMHSVISGEFGNQDGGEVIPDVYLGSPIVNWRNYVTSEFEVAPPREPAYRRITAARAHEMMNSGVPFILLDVRNPNEFAQLRIPGARLIPVTQLAARAPAELPNIHTRILVYCQRGIRSETATQLLVGMGYTNVYDFGGINSWGFETESG